MKSCVTLDPDPAKNNASSTYIPEPDSSKVTYAYLYDNSKIWLPTLEIWSYLPGTHEGYDCLFAKILCTLAQAASFDTQASGPLVLCGCTYFTSREPCKTGLLFNGIRFVDKNTFDFEIWSVFFTDRPNHHLYNHARWMFEEPE
jgi:hypothetical protein